MFQKVEDVLNGPRCQAWNCNHKDYPAHSLVSESADKNIMYPLSDSHFGRSFDSLDILQFTREFSSRIQ